MGSSPPSALGDLAATRERRDGWCPMPKDRHRHRITDKDGVISCVLCHHVWDFQHAD